MNASNLKQLRSATGISIGKCKEALDACGNDIDKAVEYLREQGLAAAVKKQGRVTNNGLVGFKANDNGSVIMTLACETDFVSKGDKFADLLEELMDLALESKCSTLDDFMKYQDSSAESKVISAVQVMGENIKIDTYKFIPSSHGNAAGYVHTPSEHRKNMGQSVCTVVYSGSENAEMKKVAMHVTASKPQFLGISDISEEFITKEKDLIKSQMTESDHKKPADILEKIIDGKMNKIYQQIALLEQKFIMDDSLSVKQYISDMDDSIKVISFEINKIGE